MVLNGAATRRRPRTDEENARLASLTKYDASSARCGCAGKPCCGPACDVAWLTERLRDGGVDGGDFHDLIRSWAEKGLVHLLRPLRESAYWTEQESVIALNAAAGAGTLMELLMAFELPLATHPVIAQAFEEEAVCAIVATPEERRSGAYMTRGLTHPVTEATVEDQDSPIFIERDARGLIRPTCAANLVANYLVSDTMAAERLLHKLAEPMVVFLPAGGKADAKSDAATAKGEGPPSMLPEQSSFPETLGALYIRRLVSVNKNTRVPYVAVKKVLMYGRHKLRTSELFEVTLKDPELRRGALIPLSATHYACVYAGEGLSTGGFVYSRQTARGAHEVVAINGTGIEHRRHSLAFGKFQALTPRQAAEVEANAADITIPALWEHGARRYAWLGNACQNGAFAYLFEDPAMNRLFPLVGSGEIMDRTIMTTPVRSELLPLIPESEQVEKWLRSKSEQRWRWLRLPGCDRARMRSQEVTIARIKARGLLHPVVLHALWITPRRQSLCSVASRAIVHTAYKRVGRYVCVDLLLQSASLCGISWLARSTRSGEFGRDGFQATGVTPAALAVAFVSARDTLVAVCTFLGYWRRHWSWSYLIRNRLFLLHLAAHLSLLIWMLAGHLGHEVSTAVGGRPLVAAAGCIAWLRLMWTCRTLEIYRLGYRILPIVEALSEAGDFILIMLFFGFSCAHVAYSLSHPDTSYQDILFSVYRLGALGDFEVPDDVLYPSDEGDGPPSSQGFQYFAFVAFSFLLAMALTNIFIGIMSSAFDFHQDSVSVTFLRCRAARCVDAALCQEGFDYFGLSRLLPCSGPAHGEWDGGKVLWLCYARSEQEGEGLEQDTDLSLRRALKLERVQIADAVDGISKALIQRLDTVVGEVKDLKQKFVAATSGKGEEGLAQAAAAERRVDGEAPPPPKQGWAETPQNSLPAQIRQEAWEHPHAVPEPP